MSPFRSPLVAVLSRVASFVDKSRQFALLFPHTSAISFGVIAAFGGRVSPLTYSGRDGLIVRQRLGFDSAGRSGEGELRALRTDDRCDALPAFKAAVKPPIGIGQRPDKESSPNESDPQIHALHQ